MESRSISFSYISFFLVVVFSTYYITSLYVSPVYIFSIIGFILYIVIFLYEPVFKFDTINKVSILIVLYFSVIQPVFLGADLKTLLNVIFSVAVLIVVRGILPIISTRKIYCASYFILFFSLPLLIFESIYRILNPPSERLKFYMDYGMEDIIFYAYKFNSIMFQDSNFVAMLILSLLFFSLYLAIKVKSKKPYFLSAILFLLLLATISRAAIFSAIFFMLLFPARGFFYTYRRWFFYALLFIMPMLLIVSYKLSSLDDSFASKFYIFSQSISYIKNSNLNQLLFGVGFGNAISVLDIGAHNIIVTFLVESGLIGLFLMVVLWVLIILRSSYSVCIVMLPFLLAGMSFASLAIPYLYAMYSIILELEDRKWIA